MSPINAPVEHSGRGHIMCNACSQPLRDHRVGHPCPAVGEARFTVARKAVAGARSSDSPEAIRKRKSRKR